MLPRDVMLYTHVFYVHFQLDSLTQPELAARLTLNCMNSYVEPQTLREVPVTIMDVSWEKVPPPPREVPQNMYMHSSLKFHELTA